MPVEIWFDLQIRRRSLRHPEQRQVGRPMVVEAVFHMHTSTFYIFSETLSGDSTVDVRVMMQHNLTVVFVVLGYEVKWEQQKKSRDVYLESLPR